MKTSYKKKISKIIRKIQIWNYSFLLKNHIESKSLFYKCFFYIFNINLIIRDILRFKKNNKCI